MLRPDKTLTEAERNTQLFTQGQMTQHVLSISFCRVRLHGFIIPLLFFHTCFPSIMLSLTKLESSSPMSVCGDQTGHSSDPDHIKATESAQHG